MTNLYDVLEVSKKASKEVIDKAYKVLAKKYHPDLQEDDKARKIAEEKMKKINEAYNILSNEEKRKIYDLKLEQEIEEENRIKEFEKLEKLQKQKEEQRQEYKQERNEQKSNVDILKEEVTRAYKTAYKKAYNDYLRNSGYKVKEPWTWEKVFAILKILGIFAMIVLVIWIFPPTHNAIMDFYEQNRIIKVLVDIIGKIFVGIKDGFVSIFTGKVIM